jgi:hypothetical protein
MSAKDGKPPHENDENLRDRLSVAVANLEDLGDRLRLGVVAILSHAIRRQHLQPGLTFDSELWDVLRNLGGEEACAAVADEIQRTQSMLRRTCGSNGGAE